MSDFFSNLLERSFTDAPVIRPRVPSLFESSADQFLDEVQSDVEIISAPAQVAPTHAKPSSVEEAAATKPITNVSAARANPRIEAPDALKEQHATKSRDESQSSGRKKLEVETKTITIAEDLLEDDENNARERDRAFDVSSPQGAVQLRRGRDRWSTQQQSSTSPTIRVTIGRVEVRAIHAPPPTRKQANPSAPKISLEDYLHKRGRGTR